MDKLHRLKIVIALLTAYVVVAILMLVEHVVIVLMLLPVPLALAFYNIVKIRGVEAASSNEPLERPTLAPRPVAKPQENKAAPRLPMSVAKPVLPGDLNRELQIKRQLRRKGYQYVERLGAGGMSEVYLIRDSVGHCVAKTPKAPTDAQQRSPEQRRAHYLESLKRLQCEREALLQIRARAKETKFISIVWAVVSPPPIDEQFPFLVLEHADGTPLSEFLRQYSDRTEEEILQVAKDISFALKVTHACGYYHQDVCTDNVMVWAKDGKIVKAKLFDFGVVAKFGEKVTHHHAGYLAPELIGPDKLLSECGELFALGQVLFAMATGKEPQADSDMPPTLLAMTIVRNMVADLCQTSPSERPQTAAYVYEWCLSGKKGNSS